MTKPSHIELEKEDRNHRQRLITMAGNKEISTRRHQNLMVFDERLAGRMRKALAQRKGITEKKMFGGLAFLLDGKMCCGIVKDEMVVRVGPDRYGEALARPHARPMDFTGRSMKGFVFVGQAGIESDESLAEWLELGLKYAGPRK
jgi:TfoX/Sxy family transcriptional regulator of competence genes